MILPSEQSVQLFLDTLLLVVYNDLLPLSEQYSSFEFEDEYLGFNCEV